MDFEEELNSFESQKLYRSRNIYENKKIFCSNDYLGMSKNPKVLEYLINNIKEIGLGSTASSLVNGYTIYHQNLEKLLSVFKDKEDCMVFPSGYSTNIGLLQAIASETDAFYSDEFNHASIIDGIRLSKAKKYIYRHKDTNHLFELLKKTRKNHKRIFVVSDSVFSMEGDIVNLKELIALSKEFEAYLILDEAHATGTIGKGIFDYYKIFSEDNVIIMGTLSKAIGSQGGFICAKKIIIEYLVNKARSYIFSTALGLPMTLGSIKAIELILGDLDFYTKSLKNITNTMINNIKDIGFETKVDYESPIIPIKIGDEEKTIGLRDKLLKKDFFIQAIRYPTVPKNKAILRLTACLNYKDDDLETLFKAFKSI